MNTPTKLFSAERNLMKKRGISAPVHHVPQPVVHNEEVLKAIDELKGMLEDISKQETLNVAGAAPGAGEAPPELSVLRGQLHDLKGSIDKTKAEIAAIHKPGVEEDKFVTAAMELSAIVQATEEATNNILGAAEDIEDHVQGIRERIDDVKSHDHLQAISNLVIHIYENCNFQDITGQRTGKVVKTINYLEERILTMINIWGEEDFEGIELSDDVRSEDEKLLEGPQLEGSGISQNDIDALFD
ncbi:protein phosphatase CheZ [Magnetovibrio sp. PR-2]|uniref:protein phosphatase CheZ n=1 Tax=Magnetovibrio sp. PR-2 TaxID=3120356 RepID=UPI002FCDE4BB